MFSQQEILSKDCYQKAFDESNTTLTIALLSLEKHDVYIVDVTKFKSACDGLAEVLIRFNKKRKLLNFYFWVRAKLMLLFSNKNTRLGVKINCHAMAKKIDFIIKDLCKELNGAKVSPLLINFTNDCNQQQPTKHN
jgi:hypothetical protein